MNETYYIGQYRDDALNGPNRGWIAGKFMADMPRQNNEVEVKYWEYKAGEQVNHGIKLLKL